MSRDIVLIGAGNSINEGLPFNLWDRIKKCEVWSVNFAFLTIPYLPQREIWVDRTFFIDNKEMVLTLQKQGVMCCTRKYDCYNNTPEIFTYEITQVSEEMSTKVYIGRMGLSGILALDLAVKENPDRIFLLGYDFGSNTNKTHYYQDTLKVSSSGFNKQEVYRINGVPKNEIKDFENFINPNIKIFNVSLDSVIPYFEKIDYPTFFNLIK